VSRGYYDHCGTSANWAFDIFLGADKEIIIGPKYSISSLKAIMHSIQALLRVQVLLFNSECWGVIEIKGSNMVMNNLRLLTPVYKFSW
jgi:hypothetical protein